MKKLVQAFMLALLTALAIAPAPSPATIYPNALNRMSQGLRMPFGPSGTAFTATPLVANRIYQRATITGGGQGKGQGTIARQVTVTQPGPLYAQIRSAADGSILQSCYQIAANVPTGAQTVNVTGVDARLGWFYVDLSGDNCATTVPGTSQVAMGDLGRAVGQSYLVRLLKNFSGDGRTFASTGIVPDPNSRVFAYWNDSSTTYPASGNVADATWALPADGTSLDSVGQAEELRYRVAETGVNQGLVAYGIGGQPMSYFAPGGGGNAGWKALSAAAGGSFRAYDFVFDGGSDAVAGTTYSQFQSLLTSMFTDLANTNSLTPTKIITPIPFAGGTATAAQNIVIRKAASDWAASNGATYLSMPDIFTYDSVHANQIGAIQYAIHLNRAARPGLGKTGDARGPPIASATRSGGNIVLALTMPSGATALSQYGGGATTAARQFDFYEGAAQANRWAFASVAPTLGSSSITVNDPYRETAANFSFGYQTTSIGSNDGRQDMIYDNHLEADEVALNYPSIVGGLATGRPLEPNLSAVSLAAISNPTYDMTATSAAFLSGDTGYGQELTAGRATVAAMPFGYAGTIEAKVSWPSKPGVFAPIFSGYDAAAGVAKNMVTIGINGSGYLQAVFNGGATLTASSPTDLSGTTRHHYELDWGGGAWQVYYDGNPVAGLSGTYTTGPTGTLTAKSYAFYVRSYGAGSFTPASGAETVDEVAVWATQRHSAAFTPPTAPYAGNEGMIALYHLDGTVTDAGQ